MPHQVDARPVGQPRLGRRVEHDQVTVRAGPQVADVPEPQGGRAAQRRGLHRLGRREPELPAGQRDNEGDRRRVRRPGVAVRGQRDGHARVHQPPGRGVRRAGAELRGRDEHGCHVGVAQRGDVGVGQVGAVVRAGRTERRRELRTGARPELVGVHVHDEALRRAGHQHRAALLGVEGARLAERVDTGRLRRAGLGHRPGHQLHVLLGGAALRYDVGAQQRPVRGHGRRGLQAAELVLDGQPVAALHLDRCRPGPQRFGGQPCRPDGQLLGRGGPRRGHGRPDPAGGVRGAGQPGLELRGPVASEHQVRVAVHKARQDAAAGRVEPFVAGRRLAARARPHHPAARHDEGRVGDGGLVVPRHQPADPVHQQRAHSIGISMPRSRATWRARS